MFSKTRLGFAALGLAVSLAGCLPHRATNDGLSARQALLDMYTEQVMDNLIRAHNNLPFVQVAYSDVTVLDNDQLGSTLAGTWPGSIIGATGNASRSATLSFVANPIVNQNDVYDAYVTFANSPELFLQSCDDPGCAAHICRKQDGVYYWVPRDAGRAFLDLALTTTFKRGPETIPPGWYDVSITGVDVTPTNPVLPSGYLLRPNAHPDLQEAILTFDKKIPSGDATLVVEIPGGRIYRISLLRIAKTTDSSGKQEAIKKGDWTDKLKTLPWSPQFDGYTENNLMGAKCRLYSHDYPPEISAGAPQLQSINANLNFLRTIQAQSRRVQ